MVPYEVRASATVVPEGLEGTSMRVRTIMEVKMKESNTVSPYFGEKKPVLIMSSPFPVSEESVEPTKRLVESMVGGFLGKRKTKSVAEFSFPSDEIITG